ncbi:hypothetical protein GRD98_17960 (plasmid) [Ralstonia solanacearum]|nr:hypothetical protein GRD98_17960 [Ralstonia solanacearum]
MKRQMSFAEAESAGKKRVTKRQRFLAEMEKVVPWQRLLSAIGPHYPRGERGKNLFGHRKVRYKGLAKNTAQLFSLFGLANLVLARRQLLASPGSIAS